MPVCNRCGGPIAFRRNVNGKAEPCELDGSDHWSLCTARTAKNHPGKVVPTFSTEFLGDPDLLRLAELHKADGYLPWEGWSCFDALVDYQVLGDAVGVDRLSTETVSHLSNFPIA